MKQSAGRFMLLAVLAAALLIRLQAVSFGLPALNDPDELMFQLGALRMLRGPTLNPGWFGHPATTTMYVIAIVDVCVFLTGWAFGWWSSVKQFGTVIYANPGWVILPGRLAMLFFALGTIALTWRLTERLFDRRTALAAAILLAVSPLHIAYSQVIRSDMMACFFMLLVMHAALDIRGQNSWRPLLRAAMWMGLTVATKWPFALAALSVAGILVLQARDGELSKRAFAVRLSGFTVLSCAALVIASPYLVLDYPTVLRNIGSEGQAHHLGATGGSVLYNARWYLSGPILRGIGVVGCFWVLAGLPALLRQREAGWLIVPLALGFFAILTMQNLVWDRWALPLMPLLVIAAAAGIGAAATRWERLVGQRFSKQIWALLLALTLLPPAISSWRFSRERMNDTRQLASAWAIAHVPPGSTVMLEHFAFDLGKQPWHFLFPLGDAGCVDGQAFLNNKVNYAAIEARRGGRANVDYGTMAPALQGTCRSDYAILTQFDRYSNERFRFPEEYAAYSALLAKGQLVATFAPISGEAGGPVVRIVHFN